MRTYHKPVGEEVGEDQLQGMEEAINAHLEKMFLQVAKRNILDFGVGRTTMKANSQDTRLDSQRRDCDAGIMFHAGRALEVALHLVYARGANRIMWREYPGATKADLKDDRDMSHELLDAYDRIVNELNGCDMKNALEIAYQRALHKGVIDIYLDDKRISSVTLAKDTPFREARIGGMADGVEYTTDHVDDEDLIFPRETTPSKFSQMPLRTFEEFLDKADASYYESDITGKRRDMRWADYYFRDHEYGRPYTVVGVEFFARLVKEIVTLSRQHWTWHTDIVERWRERHQYIVVDLMETLAEQNLEEGTKFAEPLSTDKVMERHQKMSDMLKKHPARDVNADFASMHHTKWSWRTKNKEEHST